MNSPRRNWQKLAREYADEYLLPYEVEAELNNGELPPDIVKKQKQRAIELGFAKIDVPTVAAKSIPAWKSISWVNGLRRVP